MKKHVTFALLGFLILLTTAGVAAAQQSTTKSAPEAAKLPPSVRALRTMTPASKRVDVFYRPSEAISLLWDVDTEDWINVSRTRNEYDDGLLTHQQVDLWQGDVGGDWMDFTSTEYLYDNDMPSEITNYIVAGEVWEPLDRTLYSQQDPTTTVILDQHYTSEGWLDIERTTWTLSNGYPVSGVTEEYTGTEWVPIDRFSAAEDGDDTIETYETWTGTEWVNEDRYIYTGLSIADLYDHFQQFQIDVVDYAGTYFGFRLPDYIEQAWRSGDEPSAPPAWTSVSRQVTEREYSTAPEYILRETVTWEDYGGSSWEPETRLSFQYTDHTTSPGLEGLPAMASFQYYSTGSWRAWDFESYTLQNDIRRIVQATRQVDQVFWFENVSQIRLTWADIATANEEPPQGIALALEQNYPNPFRAFTRIAYRIDEPQHVRLVVYDMLGRSVAVLDDAHRPAGDHAVAFEAARLPSGTYTYRLEVGTKTTSRQMLLVR